MSAVLISTSSFGERPLTRLAMAGLSYELNPYGRKLEEAEAAKLLAGKAGVIAGVEKLSRGVLEKQSELKVISRCGVGLDSVDLEAAKSLGIRVFNTPNAHVDAVAELTLGGMLSAMRRIPAADRSIRSGAWKKPMGSLLRGKTVGIVGLGRVGKRLVSLLLPFEVKLVASDPDRDGAFANTHRIEWLDLETLFTRSDVVSLHLPFTPATSGLVGVSLLSKLKGDAVIVNSARGGVIDEGALVEHLTKNPSASAYLDVFEKEPYSGPLATLENAVLTTHIGSYAAEARELMENEAVDNLFAGLGLA
ncbi:MAG: phosphoglycerate dehydrogenase [Deltaproteobacteria bacterium]|nr:phosphoglycerate dehydrogenase [Deltaproteobacteria bacterium]